MKRLPVRYYGVTTGQPLLSVTQVLTVVGEIDDRWFSEEAARRGSIVHAMSEQIDIDGSCDAVPFDLQGYIDAYLLFLKVVRPEMHEVELELQNEVIRIGGRTDRIVTMFGRRGILDLKTGEKYKWHPLQLAAYASMYGDESLARWGLYLSASGRYNLQEYDGASDVRLFNQHASDALKIVEEKSGFWYSSAA